MVIGSKPVLSYNISNLISSFGAQVALSLCVQKPFLSIKGIITTATLLRTSVDVSGSKKVVAKLAKHLAPKKIVSNNVNANLISQDPGVVKKFLEDPLVHSHVSLTVGTALLDAGATIIQSAKTIQSPILLIHGDKDLIAALGAVQEFYDSCGSLNKTLKVWPDLFHDVENEPDVTKVLDYIIDWISKRF